GGSGWRWITASRSRRSSCDGGPRSSALGVRGSLREMIRPRFDRERFLRRCAEQAPRAAADPPNAAEVEARIARLSPRLRRTLERELCPGEAVEAVILPPLWSPQPIRIAGLCGAAIFIASQLGVYLPDGLVWFGILFMVLSALCIFEPEHQTAFVLTTERCFQLNAGWAGVKVRDIAEMPRGLRITAADRTRLRDALWALDRRRRTGRSDPAIERARIGRGLSPALRQVVDRALMPGEALLWAERPSVRSYFANAPLDG